MTTHPYWLAAGILVWIGLMVLAIALNYSGAKKRPPPL